MIENTDAAEHRAPTIRANLRLATGAAINLLGVTALLAHVWS